MLQEETSCDLVAECNPAQRSDVKGKTTCLSTAVKLGVFGVALWFSCSSPSQAQEAPPKFEVDSSWPKPLPNLWVTGGIGGVCVDAQDHVFILNRRDLTENELGAAHQAPAVIEFDAEGHVVNSFGDPDVVPNLLHGCTVDRDNNVWIAGAEDGIVQKYSHDGSKLLLQIGKKGIVDSSDGTLKGKALNSSHAGFFEAAGITVDASDGDIYVADGENFDGNHRVAVFDRNGQFLRQWVLHRTEAEVGDAFVPIVHCIAMSNDGLVYVCDRRARRIQVFDKMGDFHKNIEINFEQRIRYRTEPEHKAVVLGTAVSAGFSADPKQEFLYVTNQDAEQIDILDRASGRILLSFGRAGHQLGEFTYAHFIAVDSKGAVYVAEVNSGKRVQKFKIVGRE
jgi:DNA-binding beta-propeller fold protein YncE